jgi:hypothetical protein
MLEAASGFEPLHKGFADLSLSHLGTPPFKLFISGKKYSESSILPKGIFCLLHTIILMERATGFEPATPTLARLCSTS